MKPFTTFSLVILGMIAVGHIARFFLRVPAAVGGLSVPLWPSLMIGIALAILVYLVWREHRQPMARIS